jgi:endogenous inhibitor of DNA gyrase (YacG/DUF329 family)
MILPTYECPTCRRIVTVASKTEAPYRPFCCRRCKLVDLGRWFDGTYAVSEPASRDESDHERESQGEP